jgi:multiple sugar transport system substrate-binding protein
MRETNKLRIAVRKFGPFETALEKMWDSFCEKNGCTLQVEMVPMELHVLHDETLQQRGLKEGKWDIAHINTNWLYEAHVTGSIENLKPYIADNPPDDFPRGWSKSLLSMQQFDDDIVGLPFHDGPECLVYRKDLFDDEKEQKRFFEQHKKQLAPPTSWDDFFTIAQFFNRPAENLYGTIFAGYPDGHNTVYDFGLQLWTRNGELVNRDSVVDINTDAALSGLEFYRNVLQHKAAIHPCCKQADSVEAGMAFARGEVAMMVNWFGFASMCEVIEESVVKGKVDITNIPKGDGGRSASLNVYWLYAIGSGSKHKDVAYEFIRYATNADNDKLLTLEGGIGCRLSTWNDPEVNKTVPYYHKLGMLHEHARSLPFKKNWTKIAAVIDDVVLQTMNTSRPIKELLQEGQERINVLEED